jgi:DNA-directed RNA polymerase subunit beta'
MLSSNNMLSPASGRPVVTPSQDIVIGVFYLSEMVPDAKGAGRAFSDVEEARMAYELGDISLHAPIKIRVGWLAADPKVHAELSRSLGALIADEPLDPDALTETTLGRALLNGAFPAGFPYVNAPVIKSDMRIIIEEIIQRYDKPDVANMLDAIKDLGFKFATKAGLTIGLEDVKTPPTKGIILAEYEDRAAKKEALYQKGVITDDERNQELIEIWTEATDAVKDAMSATLQEERFNPMDMMVRSGARGNIMQLRQIAGMRGLVANPKGDIIPQPIKANFREGLSVLEYFISTHGARKGLADTALRTADSGYLTRRLVDVSQEIIIQEEPSEDPGIVMTIRDEHGEPVRHVRNHIFGRTLAEDVKDGRKLVGLPDGRKLKKGFVLDREAVIGIQDPSLAEVTEDRVRSPLTDESRYGISRDSYGIDLATGAMVEFGTAVGIMAAQSIGEPGTQLTMRTFHTGGVAGEDITHGLPRVVELFEARSPKGKAILSEIGGAVRLETDEEDGTHYVVVENQQEELRYSLPRRSRVRVAEGDIIDPGDQLTEGPLDPKEVLEIQGIRAAQRYLVDQVQEVYRSQGVDIHDKHIEIIVRQMLRRVRIVKAGDSTYLPAELIDAQQFRETNRLLIEDGKQPAEGRPELMGITKASLATDSWLSAASFQETTRVLTEAALQSRSDFMRGLKENVIIGQLIPAGTGSKPYQEIEPMLPDANVISALGLFGDTPTETVADALPADPAEWLASLGASPTEEPATEE